MPLDFPDPGQVLYEALQREGADLGIFEKVNLGQAWRGQWAWSDLPASLREKFKAVAREVINHGGI
jgi:hypothetical protein